MGIFIDVVATVSERSAIKEYAMEEWDLNPNTIHEGVSDGYYYIYGLPNTDTNNKSTTENQDDNDRPLPTSEENAKELTDSPIDAPNALDDLLLGVSQTDQGGKVADNEAPVMVTYTVEAPAIVIDDVPMELI